MTRLLVKQDERRPPGRPVYLTSAKVDFLEKRLHGLIAKADKRYEVTVVMLRRNTRTKACEHIILTALHRRKTYFRAMRGKPLLTDGGVRERHALAKKCRHCTARRHGGAAPCTRSLTRSTSPPI